MPSGPSAADLVERADERSIELSVRRAYHSGEPPGDALIVGYAALPEPALDAGLEALGDLLAEAW